MAKPPIARTFQLNAAPGSATKLPTVASYPISPQVFLATTDSTAPSLTIALTAHAKEPLEAAHTSTKAAL